MPPTIDDLIAEMKKIEEAVKSGVPDMDKLKAEFAVQLQQMVDLQVQEKLDARPMRRVPGALIGPDGTKIGTKNRYHKFLAAFERDGCHRWGSLKTTPLDLWLTERLLSKAHHYNPTQVKAPSEDLATAVKALTSTGTGTGDEYVPTDMADSVWMDMFLSARIAGTMVQVPLTSDPFDWPLGLGQVTWRKGTQNTATTHSDPSTAKSTFTTTEQVTEQRWSYTLDEDAVIAIMPLLRAEITRSGGEQFDAFALNADATNAATGNINSDDADPADDSYYLSDGQDGIRHQWIVDNTNQTINAGGDALVDQDIVDALGRMDKYAVDPMACVITCDVQTYLKGFLGPQANGPGQNVLTIDRFGSDAIVVTGELARYRGIPIIPSSQYLRAEADARISATAANNTLGSITIYNRLMWALGFRRSLLIEVDREIQSRQMIMVTSFRQAVASRGTRSTAIHTAGIRNILV